MDRAGAASGHAAAKLGAGQSKNVAEIPEHGHRRIAVEGLRLPIDMQSDHASLPVSACSTTYQRAAKTVSRARRRLKKAKTEPQSKQSRRRYIAGGTAIVVVFILPKYSSCRNPLKEPPTTRSPKSRKTIPNGNPHSMGSTECCDAAMARDIRRAAQAAP